MNELPKFFNMIWNKFVSKVKIKNLGFYFFTLFHLFCEIYVPILIGPKTKLDQTIYCQPAMLVTCLAAWEKFKQSNEWVVDKLTHTAGFSVGEIASLVLAGVISFEDGILWLFFCKFYFYFHNIHINLNTLTVFGLFLKLFSVFYLFFIVFLFSVACIFLLLFFYYWNYWITAVKLVKIRAEAMNQCSQRISSGMLTIRTSAISRLSEAMKDAKLSAVYCAFFNPL